MQIQSCFIQLFYSFYHLYVLELYFNTGPKSNNVSLQLSRRLLPQDLPPRAIGPYPRFSAPVFLLVPSSIISSRLSIQVVFNERRLIDCFFQVIVYRNQYSIIGISLIFHIFHVFSYRKVLKKPYQ